MDGVNDLSAEEEALYDMDDAEFEAALSEARNNDDDVSNDDTSGQDELDNKSDDTNNDELDNDNQDNQDDGSDDNVDNVDNKDNPDENSDDNQNDNQDNVDDKVNQDDNTDNKDIDDKLEQSTTDSKKDVQTDDGEKSTDDAADKADDVDNSEPKEVKPQTYKYKANGQDFEFTDEEIKAQFGQVFGQAMNYTQKMQELKPWRTTISALEDNKMSHEDIELMIDVMKGDKGAMNKLMERSGVDPMELDADSDEQKYQPNQYGQSDMEIEINDIVKEISLDPEYTITQDVLSNRWDQASRDAFLDNPSLIKKLHVDVKSGDFDVLNNQALKMKTLDGGRKSDLEYYAQAAQSRAMTMNTQKASEAKTAADNLAQVNAQAKADADTKAAEQAKIDQVKVQQEKQRQVEADAEKRKSATISQKTSGKKNVVDYLEDDDEAFDEWYKKLEASI